MVDDVTAALEGALGIEPVEETEEVVEEQLDEVVETTEEDDGSIDMDDLPSNIKERAAALEVDPSLFYDAKVTLNDGSVMSIGELKDSVQAGGGNIHEQQNQVMAQQQQMQAEAALREQYGAPISQYEHALKDIEDKYKSTNWKELTDEHGDKAELARVQMQQRYTQIKGEMERMQGEYQQAMGGYANQVAQAQLSQIVKTHPTWTDPAIATHDMQEIHKAIVGTGITYEQMLNEIGGMGGAAKLSILELAAKGAAAGNIDAKRVRKVGKSLKGGKTISAAQQKRMQAGKAYEKAKGGSRRDQQGVIDALVKANL